MPFVNGQVIDEDDFIDDNERDGTPANDTGKAAKLESDAKFARSFVHQNQKITVVAGESITGATTPQACFIMSEQRINRYKLVDTSFNNAENQFEVYNNGAGTDNRIGHRFSSGGNEFIKGIAWEGNDEGNISGHNYLAELFLQDGSGNPTGAALGSQAFTNAQFRDPDYWFVEFSTPVAVSQSTSYIITIRETTTTGSSTVNLQVNVNSDPTPDTKDSRYSTNGSTWNNGYPGQSDGGFANVIVYGNINQTVGRVYLSDGDDPDRNYFDGFVNETDTAGNNVDLFYGNDVTGFTSLLPGTDYYLDTTPGAITATRARGKKIGTAKTSTTISPNYRPEISEQFNSQVTTEYDFTSSTVPFKADAFIWAAGETNQTMNFYVSKLFHESVFERSDKKLSSSNNLSSEAKDVAFCVRQGEYVRTTAGGGDVSAHVIRYQL